MHDEPAYAEAFYNLGTALKQQDDFEGAERPCARPSGSAPTSPDAHYTLGVVLWQTRRLPEAVDEFRAALAVKPAYPQAHYMLGTVLRQLGKQDEALAEFKTTIQIEPQSPEAYLSIGQILQRQQDTAGAAAAFAEADRLNAIKSNRAGLDLRAERRAEAPGRHDLDGALAQFREAVRLDPSSAPARTRSLTR